MATVDIYLGNDKYATFDEERAKEFIKLYQETREEHLSSFLFEEIEVSADFAQHVIEFPEQKLKL